jgi:hypothetical protein
MLFLRYTKLTAVLIALLIALVLVPAAQASAIPGMAAALSPLLVPLQQQHAPGATIQAQAGSVLYEGQSAQVLVMLQPGKCYTGIGVVGGSTIRELVVELTLPPSLPPLVLSQSTPSPFNTVMAAGRDCFRNTAPFPIQAIFRVTARKSAGAGVALAQLYAK